MTCLALAATAEGPIGIALPLLILVQITSFADVGALAGGAAAADDPAQRGATLALYALAGYATGFLSRLRSETRSTGSAVRQPLRAEWRDFP